MSGFGDSPWGSSPWGGGGGFEVSSVVAQRENVIRVGFSEKIFYSALLDAYDASDIRKYAVAALSSTGLDGQPARAVSVSSAVLVKDDEIDIAEVGYYLDLVLDRPFTPFPAVYAFTLADIYNEDKSEVIDEETITLYGARNLIIPATTSSPIEAFDLASPQTFRAGESSIANIEVLHLGGYVADDTGDYAVDSGIVSLKKRILRRLITRPGGFAHLGDTYGIGILDYVKRLGSRVVQQELATRAEQQIAREPEVVKCTVTFAQMKGNPNGWFMRIFVRTRTGLAHRFQVPLSTMQKAA